MPLDGTFDIWILGFFTILSLTAATFGIIKLAQKNALIEWDEANESLKWIGVVFAIADATPGLLFFGCAAGSDLVKDTRVQNHTLSKVCRYALFYDSAPSALKFWTPFVCVFSFLAVALIEARVAYGFITGM